MLTTVTSNDTILPSVGEGYPANGNFQIGQKIIYEGEEAQIIKLSPFPVVKTSNRVICGALLIKIELGKSSIKEIL